MAALLPLNVVIPLHGAVQLVSNFTRALALRRDIQWRVMAWQLVPGAIGAALGGWVLVMAGGAKGDFAFLKPVVGWTALGSLALQKWKPKFRDAPGWGFGVMGLVAGFAAPVIGAIGPIVAAFCNHSAWSRTQTIATMAAAQVYNHIVKLVVWFAIWQTSASFPDADLWWLLLPMAGTTILGTWVGAAVLRRMPERIFRPLFEIAMAVAGLHFVLSPWL
jgi:uncharacterized membrane protein YfcA